MIRILITFFILTYLPSILFAAPIITDEYGSLVDGESITITGTSFGSSGSTILVFDDFNTDTIGNTPNATATVGTWGDVLNGSVFEDSMLSGGRGVGHISGSMIKESLGNTYSEVFYDQTSDNEVEDDEDLELIDDEVDDE